MLPELEEISAAAVDAVNYRVTKLGESLEDAVDAVEASLRGRGIDVALHLSTAPPAHDPTGENVAIFEVSR